MLGLWLLDFLKPARVLALGLVGQNDCFDVLVLSLAHLAEALILVVPVFDSVFESADLAGPLVGVLDLILVFRLWRLLILKPKLFLFVQRLCKLCITLYRR